MIESDTTAVGDSSPETCPGRLLLVDDEPTNLKLLRAMLGRAGYRTAEARNGREALDILRADPEGFDGVLLDRMMPEMNGIQVLQALKADERLASLPVIMQTAAGTQAQVGEGLSAGAYYYLVKPIDLRHLLPIVQGAVRNHRILREMRGQLMQHDPLRFIVSGRFCYQTLAEAHELAPRLASVSGDPLPVAFGLLALMVNAVEHGNLELGYAAKRDALLNGDLDAVLLERARDPALAARRVMVEIHCDETAVTYCIQDEGRGFDFERFMSEDESRWIDPNGRGIKLAKELSFDDIEYQEGGSKVRVRTERSSWCSY